MVRNESVLKVEMTIFCDGLDVGIRARKESSMNPKILVSVTQRIEL